MTDRCGTARRAVGAVLFATVSILLPWPAFAHDGVEDLIAAVTLQIAASPASSELLVRRADLYRTAHRPQLALSDLNGASALNPSQPGIDRVRARVLFDLGRMDEAVNAASRFLAREPRHLDTLLVRARARKALGLRQAAIDDFTRVLDEQPTPDIFIERARVVAAPGRTAVADALLSVDEGIARIGPVPTLELEAIDLEVRLKRYDSALGRLDLLSAPAPRKETWLLRRGAILERAGRDLEARTAYRAALDAAMSSPPWVRSTRSTSTLIGELNASLARLAAISTSRQDAK